MEAKEIQKDPSTAPTSFATQVPVPPTPVEGIRDVRQMGSNPMTDKELADDNARLALEAANRPRLTEDAYKSSIQGIAGTSIDPEPVPLWEITLTTGGKIIATEVDETTSPSRVILKAKIGDRMKVLSVDKKVVKSITPFSNVKQ